MLAASLLFLVLTISVLDFFSASRLEQVPNVGQATAPLQYYANTLSTPEDLTIGLMRIAKEQSKASPEQKPVLLINAVDVSEKRKKAMLKLMQDDAEEFFKVAMTSGMRDSLPADVRKNVEEDVELDGEFEFLISDDLERGISKNHYFLDDKKGGRFNLYIAGGDPTVLTGAKVRVRGKKIDDSLALQSSGGSDFETLATAPLVNMTMKKVAVILINFRNAKSEPYTHDQIRQVTFTSSGSANAYYTEVSYGQVGLTGKLRTDGDVFGYYTIDYDNVNCSSMYSTWAAAARSMAQAQGVDLTGYNSLIYYLPPSGCGWWGLGSLGGNPASSWITSTYSLKVVGHELGHNFGAHHSSSYTCTLDGVRVPISSSCTITEYGDPFDIMGNPSSGHFNNFQKGRVGYYDAQSTLTLSTPGTYTVVPIEFATSGVRALRVPKDRDSQGKPINYYYIEYRRPYGFDSYSTSNPVVNGASIRIGRDYTIIDKPLLIDATAGTASFIDASLLVGQSFTDSAKGITITTLSAGPTEATVRVDFGPIPCTRANPTVTMSPSSQWAYAGGTLNYNVVVKNNDNFECSPSIFTVSTVGSASTSGWTFVTNPQSVSLGPGAQATVVSGVTSISSAAEGYYTLTSTAQNSQAATFQGSGSASYNVMGVDTTPPKVTITSPRKSQIPSKGNFKISGSASDESGIKDIEIFLDSTSVAYCANSGNCQVNLPASSISSGTHTITVRAEDKAATPNAGATSMAVHK
jgi:hypothetical protein